MTLDQVNKKYKYKSDKQKFGFLEVLEIPDKACSSGVLKGYVFCVIEDVV